MSDYSKVYKELYEIFKYLPQDKIDVIPIEFKENMESKMDNNYEYRVTHIEDFSNQEMLKETRALLAILYRDYWATEEERIEILEKEKREYYENEQEKIINYTGKINIFEREENVKEAVSTALVEYKEPILKRIINKIKEFFFRKKHV